MNTSLSGQFAPGKILEWQGVERRKKALFPTSAVALGGGSRKRQRPAGERHDLAVESTACGRPARPSGRRHDLAVEEHGLTLINRAPHSRALKRRWPSSAGCAGLTGWMAVRSFCCRGERFAPPWGKHRPVSLSRSPSPQGQLWICSGSALDLLWTSWLWTLASRLRRSGPGSPAVRVAAAGVAGTTFRVALEELAHHCTPAAARFPGKALLRAASSGASRLPMGLPSVPAKAAEAACCGSHENEELQATQACFTRRGESPTPAAPACRRLVEPPRATALGTPIDM